MFDIIVFIGNFILTDNFQRQFNHTDNINRGDQRKNVQLTEKTGAASIVTT
jgi:hypothetical protein